MKSLNDRSIRWPTVASPGNCYRQNQLSSLRHWTILRYSQIEFVECQEFLHDRLVTFFHVRICSEEKNFAFVQEHDPIGELFRQTHVVGDDYARQVELDFQPLHEV